MTVARTWVRTLALTGLCAALGALALAAPAPTYAAPPGGVVLPGHVPVAAVAKAHLLGRTAPNQRMSLALVLPLRNQPGLDDLLRRLYHPLDPFYGHYLTSQEFTAQFGPTQADYDKVAAFARAQGLTITGTHPNRALLDVAGPASVVESAFNIHLLRYQTATGRVFYAPDTDPTVPADLGGRLTGIVGLDNAAVIRPHYRLLGTPPIIPMQTGSGPGGALSPSDIKAAYNLSGVSQTGSGQTLGLFELDGYTASDITNYVNNFGLRAVPLQNVLIDGFNGSAGSGAGEVTLDIELQNALAPGANKIIVYEAPNSFQGLVDEYNRIATDNLAKEISTSWGLYESGAGSSTLNSENTAFQQMSAQGQSIYAAAGDSGAYDDGSTLSVDDPASQPYMVGVGGTHLATNGGGGSYSSETTWNGGSISAGAGGGGISSVWAIPSYQSGVVSGPSQGSTTMRNVPDVSLDADPNTGYAIYQGGWQIYGGTSCAAPLWAAFTALVNQQRVATSQALLGFANPSIYNVAKGSRYASDFHDIADGSTNLHYPAVAGFDDATGWGTFNGANLLADLAGSSGGSNPPTISSLSPSSATAGGAAFTLTVNGTNYVSGATVNWNGSARTTTFVSATQLTAAITAADIATAGTASVTVTANSQTSNTATFTVNNPAPVLNSISPNSATAGGSAFTLTANGSGFVSSSKINWNGTALTTTFVSASQLTASVPASDIASAGTASVTVVTPSPGGGTSGAQTFTISNSTVPTISSLSPSSATAGGAAFTLTVNGTNYVSGATVNWNGSARTTTFVSATQLTAAITAADIATAGTASVTVTENSQTSNTATFTINSAQAQQLLGNPGFENGSSNPAPWHPTAGVIDNSGFEPPHSGSWVAWLCGYGFTHTDTLYQTVTIPSTISKATLSFWLHIDTAETTTTTAYDTFKVQIRNTSNAVLTTLATYSNLNAASGYSQKSFDVTAYKGQTIRVYFIGSEDSSLQTSFVIDDTALNVQ